MAQEDEDEADFKRHQSMHQLSRHPPLPRLHMDYSQYRFIKGKYGTVQAGTQLAYSRVHTWGGIGGAPTTSMSEIFFDFRYLPFQ